MMRLRAKIRKVDGSGALCVGSGLRRWRVAGSIPDDIGREKQMELTRQLVRGPPSPREPPPPLPGLPMDLRIHGLVQLGRHRLAVGQAPAPPCGLAELRLRC
jgi:hypothetical protein